MQLEIEEDFEKMMMATDNVMKGSLLVCVVHLGLLLVARLALDLFGLEGPLFPEFFFIP